MLAPPTAAFRFGQIEAPESTNLDRVRQLGDSGVSPAAPKISEIGEHVRPLPYAPVVRGMPPSNSPVPQPPSKIPGPEFNLSLKHCQCS